MGRVARGIRRVGRRLLPLVPGTVRRRILKAGGLRSMRRWFLAGNVEWWDRYHRALDQAKFEADPREQRKFEMTSQAIGAGPFERALEIGCGPGFLSQRLAERCRRLIAMDLAVVAVEFANRRLAGSPTATAIQGSFPDDMPDGPFDLIVCSDTLYYLTTEDQDRGIALITERLTPGGIFVATHHRHDIGMPMTGDEVHARLRADERLTLDLAGGDAIIAVDRFRASGAPAAAPPTP